MAAEGVFDDAFEGAFEGVIVEEEETRTEFEFFIKEDDTASS